MARPKEFEPNVALFSAMELFWEKGYEATSIKDLVERMGINRFSMYDTFGDKHSLYIKAYKQYIEMLKTKFGQPLQKADAGYKEIKDFFVGLNSGYEHQSITKGCLLTNSIIENSTHDTEIKKISQEFLRNLENRFETIIGSAQKSGGINNKRKAKELAVYLIGLMQSLSVIHKAFPSSERPKVMIELSMEYLKNK